MYRNTTDSYGLIARIFHHVISFLIIGLIGLGFYMTSMQASPEKGELYGLHKSFGVMVLILVLLRFFWRIFNISVAPQHGLPYLFRLAAKITHLSLYVFMIIMPASGIMMSIMKGYEISVFGLFTISSSKTDTDLASSYYMLHTKAVWWLIALIILHIGAALYHHFIRKDKTLLRMLKGSI